VLIGTGSEVQVALDARDQLHADAIPARVVSMPCVEWFAAQDPAYRDTVLPPGIRARVSVEAGITSGWEKIIGDASRSVGVEHYGASADHQTMYRQFGITAAAVAAAARDSIHDAQHGTRPGGHPTTFAPNTGGTADAPPEHDG
jgi:transketolase